MKSAKSRHVFEIKDLGEALKQACAGNSQSMFRFQKSSEFNCDFAPSTFISADELNSSVSKRLTRAMTNAEGSPMGLVEFEDVFLLGPYGIILDRKNSICWKGSSIGWNSKALSRSSKHPGIRQIDDEHLEVDMSLIEAAETFGYTALWSAPGFQGYGHWLVDCLPRMFMLEQFATKPFKLYAPAVSDWARELVNLLGYSGFLANQILPREKGLSHHEQLIVPTMMRRRPAVDKSIAQHAWKHIIDRLKTHNYPSSASDYSDKLYVSRRLWQKHAEKEVHNRALKNSELIENIVAKNGFSIIYPERLHILEQMNIFSKASVIMGEDGSGLHNCIFAPSGAKIGVIHMGRHNCLHAAIANCGNQHVHYIRTNPVRQPGANPEDRKLRADTLHCALETISSFAPDKVKRLETSL